MTAPVAPESRRDRLRRLREERDAELAHDRAREHGSGGDRPTGFWNAVADVDRALSANRSSGDPFFAQQSPEPPVPERSLGPTPRGGVRHNDPYREGSPANPSFEQMKDAFDPYREESRLYRSLAGIRYQSPLAPLV